MNKKIKTNLKSLAAAFAVIGRYNGRVNMSEAVAVEKIVYAERESTTSSHEIGELTRVGSQVNVSSQLLERILCTSFERIRVGIARAQHTQIGDTQLDILSFVRARHQNTLAFNSRVEMQRVEVVVRVRVGRFE